MLNKHLHTIKLRFSPKHRVVSIQRLVRTALDQTKSTAAFKFLK